MEIFLAIDVMMALLFLAIGLYLITKVVHPTMERVFNTYDDLNNAVEENVSAIRVVKSFVLEDEENAKFQKISDSIYRDFTKAEKLLSLNTPLMQFSMYICIILISWFGAKTIVNSNMTELTTGQLMTLFTYTIQILSSLMMLSMIYLSLVAILVTKIFLQASENII